MKYNQWIYVVILFVCAIAVGYCVSLSEWLYAAIVGVIALFFLLGFISYQKRIHRQVEEFAEAVSYLDFTRRYPITRSQSPSELRMYKAFNQINQVFKRISSEKEVQHQYLSKVVNMLDSAILFYHADSGKVEWINDAFKEMFQTPHLGNIKGLEKRNKDLYDKTSQLKIGSQQMETAFSSRGAIKLLIQMSEFETQDGVYRIVVYQNISDAMDETENKAWHKLLRVLTHEIMNSIAPISSLAETLQGRLEQIEEKEEFEDIKVGIDTIKRRSEGLLKFAKSYRMINKVDNPQLSEVSVVQLFENICLLLEPTLHQKGIDVDIILKNTRLTVEADMHLMEQVLINLLLNAIEAVKDVKDPYVSLAATEYQGRVLIRISDNGLGMSSELMEQIFTPFFSTKKSGNGIGLTLSKQIMLVHEGNISVDSLIGKGTTFTLQF